ncbi:hypothetical protein AOZ07_02080 [Glutamicibacter halophytocola]|uniref:hypothetical protein n=1 Tax=Glutamicibacter halophytocola TaxID=1933880 RepID=UPI0006D4BC2F|nr:hypothetical protein [Glutamicibacter halophytocola]ALG27907.1 hypothetical protein AOZ07_02080 [Glutamicibacter halophytocola]
MRIRSFMALSMVALLMSGCSTPQSPAPAAEPEKSATAPGVSTVEAKIPGTGLAENSIAPAPAESTATALTGQAWADSKIQMWKDNSGIKSTQGFLYPNNLMTSWQSPEEGVLNIYLDNSMIFNRDGMQENYQTREDELRIMGRVMFESIGEQSPELESVTFATEDGKNSGTYSRARTGADPNDRKAWAKEKYVQWLAGMNDVYESMCHAEITAVEVYRNCLPADPHAHVDKVTSPAFGELVVTINDGPWMDGIYDTPASSFVSSNMIIKINDKAAVGEQVEKLTVIARDGEDTSTALREEWLQ